MNAGELLVANTFSESRAASNRPMFWAIGRSSSTSCGK